MSRVAVFALLLTCAFGAGTAVVGAERRPMICLSAAWAAEPAAEQPKPIPAAEAEKRVAETRDALTDLLWMDTEPYWHTGRWEECVRLCRQVVEVDPHFVEAQNSLAWLLWSQDLDDEAVKVYQENVEANPHSWQAHHEFGMYYMARQKYDQAAEQFRHSVALDAPVPHAHMLPAALERAGRKQEALQEWRSLAKRFPNDVVVKRGVERLEKELGEGAKAGT